MKRLVRPISFLRLPTRKEMTPSRGEVWAFDLGMEAKVRPVLVVSTNFDDADRARGSQFELAIQATFIKPVVFLVQNVAAYPAARALQNLGSVNRNQFESVFDGLPKWLGHTHA